MAQTIQLRQPHIEFFRSLEISSGDGDRQKEISGSIHLDDNGEIHSAKVYFGNSMSSSLAAGDLSFHTHTMLPGRRTDRDTSTDVPSPLDMSSIGLAILHHGTREHLIFTPSYIYAITWYKDKLSRMTQKSKQMGYSAFESWLKKSTDDMYNRLVAQHGKNYGSEFVRLWLSALRRFGYDVRKYDRSTKFIKLTGPDKHSGSLNQMNVRTTNDRLLLFATCGLFLLGAGLALYDSRNQQN